MVAFFAIGVMVCIVWLLELKQERPKHLLAAPVLTGVQGTDTYD